MAKTKLVIQLKRVYEPAAARDGERFLVERLWPRGIRKDSLRLTRWLKDAGPSTPLRRWFSHDVEKWETFRRKYFLELDRNEAAWSPISEAARRGRVTLVFSSRDEIHNNAVALKEYLGRKMEKSAASRAADTIASFLSNDHDRLDALLSQAEGEGSKVSENSYEEFRRGLLKHVGMEEMILLPSVRRLAGKQASLAARIRLDHGALTALLVPSPTTGILKALRSILTVHNELEERAGGLYEECEAALGGHASAVLANLRKARDIPPAAHADGPRVMAVVRRALRNAGYENALP